MSGFGAGYVAPSSHLIVPKGSPLGLYYMGIAHVGNDFAKERGDLFEQYAGRQLGQLADAEIHPEIIYRDERRSVDRIVVFDDLVLLVEVKSTRPPPPNSYVLACWTVPAQPCARSSTPTSSWKPQQH
ncbi:hypothetical protein [Streptomyces cahuitamycinicus]|uniref:hypothetical protein n=1 Tax=Streptomyces cahuitamycinicus TaxID=2070367 RepID=UPI0011AFA38E|nr:hypothetical protein [Streptomyces cahuitamycinicus]